MKVSWACPVRVDRKGETIPGSGCGGYWTDELPEKCPNCGGPVIRLQVVSVADLGQR